MGNCCCCCPKDYSGYDYVCQNANCRKNLDPEQELYIVSDVIYCSKKCKPDQVLAEI